MALVSTQQSNNTEKVRESSAKEQESARHLENNSALTAPSMKKARDITRGWANRLFGVSLAQLSEWLTRLHSDVVTSITKLMGTQTAHVWDNSTSQLFCSHSSLWENIPQVRGAAPQPRQGWGRGGFSSLPSGSQSDRRFRGFFKITMQGICLLRSSEVAPFPS